MASKYSREFIIGGLLLATLILTTCNNIVERKVAFTTKEITFVEPSNDQFLGGNSQSAGAIKQGKFEFRYDVDGQGYEYPFASVLLNPDNETLIDLSWAEHFDVRLRSSKPQGEDVWMYVRNYEPTVSNKDDNISRKFNEVLISAEHEMKTFTFDKDDFTVPAWWKTRFNVTGPAVYPSFENVEWFEFSTTGDAGKGFLEIESILCRGSWIQAADLNKILLWLWMGGALAGILYRMSHLKQRLNEKTASAMQLLQHNNLLMSKSATYRELARRDSLTGLFNRYGMEGQFEEMSGKDDFTYSLILFDLDNFKQINDSFGHCYGDRVLFDVARIVKAKINAADAIARWGGDEFLVVLSKRDAKQAAEFAEEVRCSVLASDLQYTCSFGVSENNVDESFKDTLRLADAALYASKDDGRNTINVYQHCQVNDPQLEPQPPLALMPPLSTDKPTGDFSVFD